MNVFACSTAAAVMVILGGVANAQDSATVRLHIPSTSVADAVNQWAQQTGFRVVWEEDASTSTVVPQLDGTFTPRNALERLLHDTRLHAEFSDARTAIISRAESHAASTKPGSAIRLAASTSDLRLADSNAEAAAPEEVLVTAQKRTENVQDVPVPVTVLDTATLANNNQVLLRDYYASVPGLSVTPNIESSQILSIRGISTGNFTNPTVGVLVDDALFTPAIALTFQVPDVDPGDLARVEVLRGPQGTLYGANSMGGLIKYVTIDPSTESYGARFEAGTANVYHGSEPAYNLRAAVNVPLSDTLAFRVSGFSRQDPGYINNPILHINGINEDQAEGGRFAALWRPSEEVSLKVNALYQNTKGNGLSEADKEPGLGDLQQSYIPGAGPYDGRLQAYSATINAKLSGVALTSVTAYNKTDYHDTWDGGVFYGPGALWADQFANSNFMQEIRASSSIGQNIDWLAGAFYTHEHGTHSYNIVQEDVTTGEPISALGNGTLPISYSEYAAYADLTYHFTERFDIQVGGRESHIKVTNEPEIQGTSVVPAAESTANAFTYLVTPELKIAPGLMAYARFASGYRPGGPNLAYAVQSVGAPAAFSPDKTYNYEVGTKGDFFDGALSIDASAYYIDWQKIQLQLSIGSAGYDANGGGAKSEGVELSAAVKPMAGLRIAGWISWDDAVLTEAFPAHSSVLGSPGDRLPNVSRFSGNLSIQQSVPLTGKATGFVGGQMTYVGNREGLFVASGPRQYYPSYVKTDLHAGFEYQSWVINTYANNVANKRGVINTVNFFPDAFIYIQPRTIGIDVSKSF
jgi:iron complex outermembrane receptor protein